MFKRCSTCKAPLSYGEKYYRCSVSTCNRRPTALYFCSVPCWDAHVPDAKHRDAWAEVETAPSGPEEFEEKPLRRKVSPPGAVNPPEVTKRAESRVSSGGTGTTWQDKPDLPRDVLVVMSKVKGFIKAYADVRTSEGVSDPLSDHLRDVCERAVQSARKNGRGTVLARDIEAVLRGEDASD